MAKKEHYNKRGYYTGYTDERGNHYNRDGKYTGRTDSRGNHYNRDGYYSGKTNSNGYHYNRDGYYTGRTDSRGDRYNRNGYYTGTTKESSGGCYLTTACVEYRGLEDDCYELTTLRNFRDTYMKANVQSDVEEYYKVAPGIVDKINLLDADSRKKHYDYIYGVITNCCNCIESNELSDAYEQYKEMVNTLVELTK